MPFSTHLYPKYYFRGLLVIRILKLSKICFFFLNKLNGLWQWRSGLWRRFLARTIAVQVPGEKPIPIRSFSMKIVGGSSDSNCKALDNSGFASRRRYAIHVLLFLWSVGGTFVLIQDVILLWITLTYQQRKLSMWKSLTFFSFQTIYEAVKRPSNF